MCQTTLIKGLSFHQRTQEEDTCVRRLSSKDSLQTTLIKGLSSSYFNRFVGIMHKDTSVCVSHTFMCALNRMCSYVAPEKDLRL